MHNKTFAHWKHWFGNHGLFALSLFLFIFIPLYPKLPLLDAIPGYLVRVRFEDVLVLGTGAVWLVQLLRGKIQWWNRVTGMMLAYAGVGLLSLIFAVVVLQSIPLQFIHLGKSVLHYFRYLEYFSLFLFTYSGIQTKQHVRWFLKGLCFAVVAIIIYGFGQRFLQWPLFSTMNREYSKGEALQLSDLARVQSTFGGHYDLAAYLLIALPILLAWALSQKNRKQQIILGVIQLAGVWLLWASGAKLAFVGYLIGIGIIGIFYLSKWIGARKALMVSGGAAVVGAVALVGLLAVASPAKFQKLKNIFDHTSMPSTKTVPSDVVGRENETWSPNAIKYGLSMGIRLDTLWPQALKGWTSNPWLGKGYATLNKQGTQEFTEADSTDNNYLRVLGETGLLGFVSFASIIVLLLSTIRLQKKSDDASLVIGLWGATIALLVNAVIIDVFAASKVAFTYWAVAGLVLKSQVISHPQEMKLLDRQWVTRWLQRLKRSWIFIVALAVAFLLMHKQPFSERSLVQSVELSPNSLQSITFAYCLDGHHPWTFCQQASGITHWWDYGYALYLLPWYLIFYHPSMYYFANIALVLVGLVFLYKALQRGGVPRWFQLLALLVVVSLPAFYQLPAQSTANNLLFPLITICLFLLATKIHFRLPNTKKLWVAPFAYIAFIFLNPISVKTILHNYRDNYQPWRYQAVRRTNTSLEPRNANGIVPDLITAINPTYFNLYGNGTYTITPLAANQLSTYETLLNTKPEVYLTNADIERSSAFAETFESLKQHFGIQLRDLDCELHCNVYRLYPQDIPLPTQPESINHQRMVVAPNEPTKIMIVSQRFGLDENQLQLTTPDAAIALKTLSDREQPNAFFLLGDAVETQDENSLTQFHTSFSNVVNFPISYIPGNWDKSKSKVVEGQQDFFRVGNAVFVSYNPDKDGKVSPSTRLFLYNIFLQLEKHPEIRHVFLITHRSSWLAGDPAYKQLGDAFLTETLTDNDLFYARELVPQMEKFSDKQFFVISGDIHSPDHPTFLYQPTENGHITYLATARNNSTHDTYLTIKLRSDAVDLNAYALSGESLNMPDYSLDFWKQAVANLPK